MGAARSSTGGAGAVCRIITQQQALGPVRRRSCITERGNTLKSAVCAPSAVGGVQACD